MRLFITFAVQLTHDGEPLWRQVDWRVVESGNGYGRDAARQFAASSARANTLYATVLVSDSNKSFDDVTSGHVYYWQLAGASPSDYSRFWDHQSPQAEEEGRER